MPNALENGSVTGSVAAKSNGGNFQAGKEGWLKTCASYPNLSGADMAVAVVISTYVNSKTHEAWPSLARLAADTNRSPSTVWRAVRRLEEFSLIEVIHGRGRHKSNRYRPKFGEMDIEPTKLKRLTTWRGKILRTRNSKAAESQLNDCELAARTLDQPHMKCREEDSQEETTSKALKAVA